MEMIGNDALVGYDHGVAVVLIFFYGLAKKPSGCDESPFSSN